MAKSQYNADHRYAAVTVNLRRQGETGTADAQHPMRVLRGTQEKEKEREREKERAGTTPLRQEVKDARGTYAAGVALQAGEIKRERKDREREREREKFVDNQIDD